MDSTLPIEKLPGIGSYFAKKLKRLEIKTVEDLIYHFPFRYDDFSKIGKIAHLKLNEKSTIQGTVWQIKNIRTKTGKIVTIATIADQSGTLDVIWFNQPFLIKTLKPGTQVSLSGKAQLDNSQPKLISPSYEILRNQKLLSTSRQQTTLHTARLVPIYPETEGITSKWLRGKIAKVLPLYLKTQKDYIPKIILKNQNLESLNYSLEKIHFPKTYKEVRSAQKRLSFDELFLTQLAALVRKHKWQEGKKAPKFIVKKTKLEEFIQKLPFKLTNAQKKAIEQILNDLKKETPANRLLEGDVGSGKTVVAATAAYFTSLNGFSTLVAAPTEILAFQHQKTLEQIFSPYKISVGVWTASKKIRGDVTCGTHALLNKFEPFLPTGLVVVDEQHRFGVAQRGKLFLNQSKKITPHLLTMTATPIPRTLALTLYGDLDLSVLDEMPKGRQKIATFVVPNSKRRDAYRFIEKQIGDNRQVFIITPFVESSETMTSVKAAVDEFAKLKKKFPSKINLGLLHGRLKSKEKEKVISKFKEGKIDILVATPVVEVGIDIPNATIMLIESAERFGLAQLHQLRGRVGRGKYKSYCFLFTSSSTENSLRRLRSMEKIHVGFELAEIDLKMRGAGEIFGLKQSGFANFKIADFSDRNSIIKAQKEAKKIIEEDKTLKKYPLLAKKILNFQSEYIQPN